MQPVLNLLISHPTFSAIASRYFPIVSSKLPPHLPPFSGSGPSTGIPSPSPNYTPQHQSHSTALSIHIPTYKSLVDPVIHKERVVVYPHWDRKQIGARLRKAIGSLVFAHSLPLTWILPIFLPLRHVSPTNQMGEVVMNA